MWNPYFLEALLISEKLKVLMEFQMMLIKEAIKGRLHVSELREKPTEQREKFRYFQKLKYITNVCNHAVNTGSSFCMWHSMTTSTEM